MKLFKKEEKKSCCNGSCSNDTMANAEVLKNEEGIKILGSGCAKCITLENTVKSVVLEEGFDIKVDHITFFFQIASYGVMSTPALVLNGKVLSYGKVLNKEEVKVLLFKQLG